MSAQRAIGYNKKTSRSCISKTKLQVKCTGAKRNTTIWAAWDPRNIFSKLIVEKVKERIYVLLLKSILFPGHQRQTLSRSGTKLKHQSLEDLGMKNSTIIHCTFKYSIRRVNLINTFFQMVHTHGLAIRKQMQSLFFASPCHFNVPVTMNHLYLQITSYWGFDYKTTPCQLRGGLPNPQAWLLISGLLVNCWFSSQIKSFSNFGPTILSHAI